MRRILAIVALAVLASLSSASAAGAQQYPPTTQPTAVEGEQVDRDFGGGQAGGESAGAGAGAGADSGTGSGAGAPLARTGSDVMPLVLLGAALVAAGAFWVVTSRVQRAKP